MSKLKKVFVGAMAALALGTGGITAQSIAPNEVAPVTEAQAAAPWSELYRNYNYWGRGKASGNVQASGPRYVNVYCSDGRVYYSGTRWGRGERVTAYCPWGRYALNSAMSYNNRIIHWA